MGRTETTTGIVPFGRLVEQVMTSEPCPSAGAGEPPVNPVRPRRSDRQAIRPLDRIARRPYLAGQKPDR
jgi:hypothetical protein